MVIRQFQSHPVPYQHLFRISIEEFWELELKTKQNPELHIPIDEDQLHIIDEDHLINEVSSLSVNLTGCMGFRVKAYKLIDNPAPCNNHKKTSALKLDTWNVWTMTPGFSDELQEIDDMSKTAVINMELSRLQMDIVALQETRLLDSGSVKGKNFSSFCQGKPLNETREYGVGFAVRNTLLRSIVPPTVGSERILSLLLHSLVHMHQHRRPQQK